jgi:hypothetical protein
MFLALASVVNYDATIWSINLMTRELSFMTVISLQYKSLDLPVAVVDGVGGALLVDRVRVPLGGEDPLVLHAAQDVHLVLLA